MWNGLLIPKTVVPCSGYLRVMDIAQALVARLELLARDGHDQVDYLTKSAFTDRSL